MTKFSISETFASKVSNCTPELLSEALNSPKIVGIREEIARLREKMNEGVISPSEYETQKAAAKKRSCCIMPHASFPSGKRCNEGGVPSGLYGFDLDHMKEEPRAWYLQNVSGREGKLGIGYAEVSLSGNGLHIIGLCPDGVDVELSQRWLARQLNIAEYDAACKDLARCFFLSGDTLYRDNNTLFANQNRPVLTAKEVAELKTVGSGTEKRGTTNDMSHVAPSSAAYKGVPYADIYKVWETQHGGAPTEGRRNTWLHRCISAFKSLTGDDAGLLSSFIPRHGLPEQEFQSILRSALKTPATGIWNEMKEVLSTFKLAQSGWWRVDSDMIDTLQRRVLKNLPLGLKDTLSCVPADRKMNVLSVLMPIMGTYADAVRTAYFSNEDEEQKTAFMVGLVARSGVGKSAVVKCLNPWTKPLREEAAKGEELIDEYKEKQETRSQTEEAKKPHPVIRYAAATASQSYIFEKLKYAKHHCIFSEINEVSGLNSGTGGGWNELSEVLRLAFDWEHYQRGYTSKESVNYNGDVKWNLIALGTPGAWWKFFGGSNMENGLANRFLLAFLPDELGQKPAPFKKLKDEHIQHINEAIEQLSNAKGKLPMRQLNKAMEQWAEGKRQLVVKYQDATLDAFYHRAAVIGFRCGLINHLLTGDPTAKETPTTIRMGQLMAEYALQGMLRLLGDKTEKLQSKYQLPKQQDTASQWECILAELPTEFTRQNIRELRPDLTTSAINRAMQRRVQAEILEKIRDGEWRKR